MLWRLGGTSLDQVLIWTACWFVLQDWGCLFCSRSGLPSLCSLAREPVRGFHKNTILKNQFILLQFVILINKIELVQFFISFSFLWKIYLCFLYLMFCLIRKYLVFLRGCRVLCLLKGRAKYFVWRLSVEL